MPADEAIAIRRIHPDDWEALRALRLAAMEADPLAFGSTLRREQESAPEKWKNWAARGGTGGREAIYLAIHGPGELVGMIGAYPEDERFHVWGMWVRPERRSQGIGGRLLDALLEWLASIAPSGTTLLEVNPVQEAAVELYTARGFLSTGRTRPLGHSPPAIVEEMARAPTVRK